jgi:hypothetical protein
MNYQNIDFTDIDSKYLSLETYIEQMAKGKVRSLIVHGPPGVGKTYSASSFITKYSSQKNKSISGHMSLLSLYVELYRHRAIGQILILDDVDSVMNNLQGLNILKAAMDTRSVREISWESTSSLLPALGVPNSFQFDGGVILITNAGFANGSKKHIGHLNALKDRSFCINLGDQDQETIFKYCCYAVLQKGILSKYELTKNQENSIIEFIEQNMYSMHNLSLRSFVKCAELMSIDPVNWKLLAINGLVKI